MKKTIIYFHGYGSSPSSDKVVRLKQNIDFDVYAYPADIDPDIAVKQIGDSIDLMLADNPCVPTKMIFIGTSLGGWLASKMAQLYDCEAYIINPSVNPTDSLKKYGVPDSICDKYTPLVPCYKHKYYFADIDIIIPNVNFRTQLINAGYDVTIVKNANHQFSGEAFETIIQKIKTN